jgi:hypothetical protein
MAAIEIAILILLFSLCALAALGGGVAMDRADAQADAAGRGGFFQILEEYLHHSASSAVPSADVWP